MKTNGNGSSAVAVIEKVFALLNARDLDALSSLTTDDITEEWPIVGHLEGRAAVVDHFRNLFGAMPDLRLDVVKMAADGETVFVHWRARGTFTGTPFAGFRATGRSIDLRGTDCFAVRNGKVTSNFIAFDGLSFGAQAGILPRPGSTGDRMMTKTVNAVTRVRSLLHV